MKKVMLCYVVFVGTSFFVGWESLVGMDFFWKKSRSEVYQIDELSVFPDSENLVSSADLYQLKEIVLSDGLGVETSSDSSQKWMLNDCDEVNLRNGNLTIIQIEQGQQAMLKVKTDKKALSSIALKMVGRCLTLGSWHITDIFRRQVVNYELYISSLNSIQISGSSHVEIMTPFKQEKLEVNMIEASEFKADNLNLQSLKIIHSSKGHLCIRNLLCKNVYAELLESGSLEIGGGYAGHQTFFVLKNSDIKIKKLSGSLGDFMIKGKRVIDVNIDSQVVLYERSEGTIMNYGRASVVSGILPLLHQDDVND